MSMMGEIVKQLARMSPEVFGHLVPKPPPTIYEKILEKGLTAAPAVFGLVGGALGLVGFNRSPQIITVTEKVIEIKTEVVEVLKEESPSHIQNIWEAVVACGGWTREWMMTHKKEVLYPLGGIICFYGLKKTYDWIAEQRKVNYRMTYGKTRTDGGYESLVAGSELMNVTSGFARSEAIVARVNHQDRTHEVLGSCQRIENSIFMPHHYASGGPMVIISNTGRAANNFYFEFDSERIQTDQHTVEHVREDLLQVEILEDHILSNLQMKKPTVERIGQGKEVSGSVKSLAMRTASSGTMGHGSVWGKIKYAGSTTKGMCGAAYTVASKVVAMHHYGNPNLGYAATYMKMLANRHKEASEDFFLRQVARYGSEDSLKQAVHRYEDDYELMTDDGDYVMISVEDYDKWERKSKKLRRTNYEARDSKNLNLPGTSRGLSTKAADNASTKRREEVVRLLSNSLSTKELEELTYSKLGQRVSVTDTQE
nr:MAG: protease-like protein [Solemoviridae sp.]